MPYAQDLDTGEWIEVDAQGNPVAAAPHPAGRVFTLPKSPDQVRKDQRDAAKDARDAENDAIKNRLAEAELELKKQQLAKGQTAGGNQGTKVDQAAVKRAQVEALTKQMLDVDLQLREHFEGANDRGWREYLPTPTNKAFDSAAAGLSEQALGAFRVPGVGSQSDAELRAFNEANRLDSGNYDEVNRQRFDTIRNRVDETRAALGMAPVTWPTDLASAQQHADNEVPQANGAATKPPPSNPSSTPPENGSGNPPTPWDQPNAPPGNTVATGPTKTERSDRLSAQVDAMMNAGAGIETINAALRQQNFPPITPDSFNAAKKWMRDNPGKQYFGADVTRETDLPLLSRVAGSELGSGLASYADSATGGIGVALAGDKGRGAIDAMKQVNPNASAVGNILGGITGAAGTELAVAARAPAALARYAPRIADTLYGGVSGFNNAQEGEGGTGAAIGAATGLGGGFLGEQAVRGVGALTQGVRNPNVRALRDAGVNLTVGQTVGDSGAVGAGIKKLEDAGTSLPFIGNMIDARRREGLRDFNDAAFQRAAAPGATVTARGAEGMGQVQQGVRNAYSQALDPVTIDATDLALINDLGATINSAQRIPNVNSAQDAAMAALQARIDGAVDPVTDTISGRNFQEAYRGLARTGRERANGDYGHEVGQVMRQGQDALGGALERQNPGAFDQFIEANAANRRANVLADALKNAGNQGEELITPAQLNRADITSASRFNGKIDSASGNRPFYDLATAGQAVLPSKLPDSGTATRAAVMGGLGMAGLAGGGYAADGGEGAATGTGIGLGATIALALGGSRPAQQIATRMLLDRPDLAVRIGEQINRNARIGGWSGAGILTPLVVGQ
jgi:hypothetical protein